MRQKIIEGIMGILLLIGVFSLAREGGLLVHSTEVAKQVIVIDPGHGGDDPGVVGIDDIEEKTLNLEISLLLKKELESKGLGVVMTREKDCGLYKEGTKNKKVQDMQNRCKIIEQTKPVCAISIHQNSYPDENVCDPQVFYYTHSNDGKILAEILQEALNTQLEIKSPRVAKANASYYMLKRSSSVTVIIECGFLSNTEDARKLKTKEYQKKAANIICSGLLQYLEKKDFTLSSSNDIIKRNKQIFIG